MSTVFKKLAAAAMTAAIAINTAWAEENAADSFWAGPGGVGDWGGPNWYYTLRNGNSYFTEGKTAYFTNETSVIDLGGRTFDVYTLRNPLANGERVSVTVTNGTISIGYPVASSDGDDNYNLKNFDLVGGAGANIVNAFSTSGFQLMRNTGLVLKDGATLTETYSDQSTSKFNVGCNATSGTSNFVYIASGSSLYTPRYIQIGGSNSDTSHPTGIVTVAGANASLDAQEIWLGYVDGASASGGYGGLFVTDGARAVSRSTFLMGTDYVNGNDIYRGVSELVVSGEGSSLEVGSSEADKNFSVREYGTKKVLVENGGRLTIHGEFRNYAVNDHIHAFDVMVKNGGVLEFKNIYFSNHNSGRMEMPGQGKCSFTVDGGTTRALASFTTATANGDGALHAVTVGENGWIFDTQDYDVTWRRAINYGTGTFTKTGSGYFEFNYVPTFPGTIDVREGHIGLAGSSAKFPGAFVLRSGTAFLKTVEFSSEQDASFTLEADSILQPYQSSSSAAPTAIKAQSFTLPETGAVKIRLGDSGANTAPVGAHPLVTILGEGVFTQADLAKFVCMSSDAVKSLALSADGKSIVLNVGAPDVCVWTGATGDGLFSTPGNWAGGVKPTVGDNTPIVFAANGGVADNDIGTLSPAWIEFRSGSGVTSITGGAFTGIAAITNLSTSAMTFNAPVTFAGTYSVVKSGAVVFAGGATATYPDAAQRTSSSSDLNRTLSGSFTFTGDWSVPDLGTADKPWIIPSGSEVHGKLLTGTQTNRKRILKIENNASAHFTVMTNGWSIGDIDVNGTLEVDGEVVVKTYKDKDGWSNFGTSGNTGTVKAGKFAKVDSSYVYSRIPNLVVGAGGIGSIIKDWSWRFYSDTTIKTAESDFEFLGVYNSGSTSDWGVYLASGVTLTVDVGEGRTVTMGAGVYGDGGGAVRKTGAGTLVMSNTYNGQSGFTKSYTKGTTVEGGTLKVLPNGMPASGTVTFHGGTTLQLPAAGSDAIALGTALAVSGEGDVFLKLGEGTETIAEGTYSLFTASVSEAVLGRLRLVNPTAAAYRIGCYTDGTVVLYVGDPVPETAGECVWIGAAGDGKFSTAANWAGGRRPQNVGASAVLRFNTVGGNIENDVEGLSVASINFGKNVNAITISGKDIAVSTSVANLSSTVVPIIDAKVVFSGVVKGVGKKGTAQYPVNMRGGATGTALEYGSGGGDNCYNYYGKFTLTGDVAGEWFSLENGTQLVAPNVNCPTYNVYFNAGSKVVVPGALKSTNWENKSSNQERFKTLKGEVTCGTFRFAGTNWGTKSYLTTSGNGGGTINAGTVANNKKEGPQYMHPNGGTMTWIIGAGGLKYESAATSADAVFAANQDITLNSSADWELARNSYGGGNKGFRFVAAKTVSINTSDYTEKDASGAAVPRRVTLTGIITGGGRVSVKGTGTVVINAVHEYTAHTDASNFSTLEIPAGMKPGTGNVTLKDSARLFLPGAGSGTATVGSALVLNAGTSLVVTNLSSSVTPLSVGSVSNSGAILLVEGETPLDDGDYTILTAGSDLDASVAGNFSLGGSAVAGKAASLSVNGANLVLTVAGEGLPASPFHVWTGGGETDNFSEAANWQRGVAPQAGDGKGIFFQSASGTLVNDIPGLTPPWITFGAGIGETTIAGVNGFTDILAVTNLSTAANATFAVPVAYAAGRTIEVDHRAEYNNDNATYSREKGAVVFAGGVTGEEIRSYQSNGLKSGPHNVYAGQYVRTSDTTFQATLGGSHWRSVIYPGSSLTVKSSTKTGELDISAGGAFTTGVATITSDGGLNALAYRMGEDSEVVVTERVETSGTGDRMMWRSGSKKAVFKVNGFLQSMTGNWLYLADNNIDEQYGVFYVGPDGFNFSSSSAGGSFALGRDNAASRNTLRPWTNDFTVATRGTSEKDFVFIWNNTICTDDENGIGRKITFNAIPQFTRGTQGSVTTISGSGTFEMNSAVVNSAADNVEHIVVTNTATLAFGNSSACLTRGPMTMAAGTTLAVPGGVNGASITLGSTLSVVGDGKVKLVIGDGSGLAAGDYGVCVVTGGITAEDAAASFALQNATADDAELYVRAGVEVRLSVGGVKQVCTWTGAADDGNKFSTPGNWSPEFVPANGSELVFPSGSGALENDISGFAPKAITFGAGIGETTISGKAISGVLAVTNLSESVQTFSNEVAFAGVYRAYCASDTGFVKFPGGATASYPDASLRTTTGTIASRTLDGNFTFTADWTIGNVGNDNYPWIVASGANVTGKALTGTEERQMFQVDEGGYACFTTVAVGKTKGNISVNGTLEATESISVGVSVQHAAFGKSGDTGTVKAPVIKKVDGYSVYCYIPNLIAGSGGIGAAHKDYVWQFQQDTTITATDDFDFLGVLNGNDWGLGFNGHTVTMNVPEGLTVTFGVGENANAGILRKTGAGTLVMSDTYNGQSGFVKAYTGGTTVEGGTLKVLANGMPASGTVTFHAGTTLAVPGDAAVALGTALAFAGEGTVGLVIGDGSTLADGDYPVVSTTATLPEGFAAKFALQNPTESEAALYSTDGKTLRLAVGNASYTGPKVWTGAAGDGKLATAGNWLGESVPAAGDDIFIDAISAGTIDNDLGIAVKSITFNATTAPVTITGNAFTGVAAVTNLSATVNPVIAAPVRFTGDITVKQDASAYGTRTSSHVVFQGGAYAAAGHTNAPVTIASVDMFGNYFFDNTASSPFSMNESDAAKRFYLSADSTLFVPYADSFREIYVDSGAAVTTRVMKLSATSARDDRLSYVNKGEVVITEELLLTGSQNKISGYSSDIKGSVFKIEKIVQSMSDNRMFFAQSPGNDTSASEGTFFIGQGGLTFGDSCLKAMYSIGADNAGSYQTIRPWHGFFTIERGAAGRTAAGELCFKRNVTFCTDDESGAPGRIIVNGRLLGENSPVMTVSGAGVLELNASANNSAQPTVVVTNTATLKFGASGVTLTTGAVTFCGGTTLAVPGDAAVALGSTLSIAGEGKVNVSIGDGSALADGDYPVATVTGGIACDVATSFALANPNGGNVHFYSTDGKTLRVAVGENAYTGPCVWTGEAGDGKFSTDGNWVAGKVPSDGAAIVFNAMERSAVENDLGELQIDSVTFGAKCSNVGISGGAFTGVKTVANLSGATQFFYAPVVFGNDGDAAIDVTLSSTSAFVGFVGGVKGTAPANHTVYSGKYTLTGAEWTPLANSTLKEYGTIDAKKLLTPPTTALTIEKGAVVDAEEFEALDNGADTRASNKNNGTFKIGTLTVSRSAKSDLYLVNDASGTGIFEIGKIVQNGTRFFRINSDVAVGEGGLEFNSGDYCITITGNKMYPNAQKVEIKEAEGKSGGYLLLYNAPVTFDTTRYGTADEPAEWVFKRPVKYNSTSGYSQPLNITGCGKVTYSAPLADSTMQAAVNVNDSATLAISAGCKVTTGAITVAAGATLAAPESGEAAQIGGACTFATGSTLEFVISGASNSSFAFTSAPTGSTTVKFAPGFNPTPGQEFTLATGVGVENECTFALDPKYGGTLEVDKENGTLVYKARDYFYIRITENDAGDFKINPVWFYEHSTLGDSITEETVKSTAPNGMSYLASYLMGYEPLDPDSNFKLTGASGDGAGKFKAAATFDIPDIAPTSGTYKAEAVLLGSDDGVTFSRVDGVDAVGLTPGDGEQVAEFSFATSDLGDRKMRFFA